jgi:hypothetical protein
MSRSSIQIDDHGVRRELPGGKVEQVAWDDLWEVVVRTTGDGPFAEDVFFVLAGEDGTGCVVPQGAPESTRLLERLQRLPGFDNAALIRAMSSTEEARFVCWRRSPGAGEGRVDGP